MSYQIILLILQIILYAYCTNIKYNNIIIIIISVDLKKEFLKMYLMLNIINKKMLHENTIK